MLAQARGKLVGTGGDRPTPLELRPLAIADLDDSDEDDADWGLPPTDKLHGYGKSTPTDVGCGRVITRIAAAFFLLGITIWGISHISGGGATTAGSGRGVVAPLPAPAPVGDAGQQIARQAVDGKHNLAGLLLREATAWQQRRGHAD